MSEIISFLNTYFSYILIVTLLGFGIYFSIKSRFVQFRMIPEMLRSLKETDTEKELSENKKHISSFQAFIVSLASRVGTGNLAGVASAIAIGGPGAVFWMWVIALLGAVNAFIESTLAQLYKSKSKESYIGGPAYYMEKGIGKRWMGIIFAVLICITFGFAFNSVQSNTICASLSETFSFNPLYIGIALTIITLIVTFGGIHRIAKVSSIIVPIMAIGYILLALFIVVTNFSKIPEVIRSILDSALGWEQLGGGTFGAIIMQGIKRGLFSNEAGMGSAPNAAATATVSHPVKQGLIQTLGVFVDTLIICSCTAFIILINIDSTSPGADGIILTQQAISLEIGSMGKIFIALAILLFAYSSILGNYYYGESNIRFITKKSWALHSYRVFVAAMVMIGSLISLNTAWGLADITMSLMTICNLIALALLGNKALVLLKDYLRQRAEGIKTPIFKKESMPEFKNSPGIDSW